MNHFITIPTVNYWVLLDLGLEPTKKKVSSKLLYLFVKLMLFVIFTYAYRRLKSEKKNVGVDVSNSIGYAKVRKSFDTYQSLINSYIQTNIIDDDLNFKKPYDTGLKHHGMTMKRVFKVHHFVVTRYKELKIAIDSIDKKMAKSDVFTFISEKELWDSRSKAYDYKV